MRNDSAAWRCRFAFVIIAVRYTSMLLSLAQNATTNGGDASRVGTFFSSLISHEKCHVHTQNKGSQTGLITNLSVSLCLRNRQAVPYRSNTL